MVGAAMDLCTRATEYLQCTEKYECRSYRQELKYGVAQVERVRRLEPWEYLLLSAATQTLHPTPGCKHSAVTMLRNAVDEYDHGSSSTWHTWHKEHAAKEPAYV